MEGESFSQMFEHTCHGDPFHVAKGAIEKQHATTGRYKVPLALRDACAMELRFIDKLVREQMKEQAEKDWSKKKQIELEYYYMHEWGKMQAQICLMLGNGCLERISGNVAHVQHFFEHLTIMVLMEQTLSQGGNIDDAAPL